MASVDRYVKYDSGQYEWHKGLMCGWVSRNDSGGWTARNYVTDVFGAGRTRDAAVRGALLDPVVAELNVWNH
jgi:hypothetical protein